MYEEYARKCDNLVDLIGEIEKYVTGNRNADIVLLDDRKRTRAVFTDFNADGVGWYIPTPSLKRELRAMVEDDRNHYNDVLFHGKGCLVRFMDVWPPFEESSRELVELVRLITEDKK